MVYQINISVKNLNETKYLAKVFSLTVKIPLFLSLKGKIGTGKTTFANFLINQIAKKKIKVLSPTFPIVNIYNLKKQKFGIMTCIELVIKRIFQIRF